jgi:hypothetical protein
MSPAAKQEAKEKESQRINELAVLEKIRSEGVVKKALAKTATSSSPKADFFGAAMTSSTWWNDWKYHYSEPNGGSSYVDQFFIAHSETIKKILESDYGVIVPFDPSQIERAHENLFIINYVNYGVIASGDNCAALTPVALSNAVSAVTVMVAPELAFPKGNPLIDESNPSIQSRHLQNALKELGAYCPSESKKIIPALNQFLEEYKQILTQKIELALLEKTEREAKNKEQQRVRELEQRAKEDAEKVAAKREAENRASALAALQKEQEKQQELKRQAYEKEKMMHEKYSSDIKAGILPLKSLNDATIFYSPAGGNSVIAQPPINADNKFYKAAGKLVQSEGNQLLVEVQFNNDVKYFKVVTDKHTKYEEGFSPRFDGFITIVGKNSGTFSYTTVAGVKRYGPVFEAAMVGQGSNY